jgi:hypothetical protein
MKMIGKINTAGVNDSLAISLIEAKINEIIEKVNGGSEEKTDKPRRGRKPSV